MAPVEDGRRERGAIAAPVNPIGPGDFPPPLNQGVAGLMVSWESLRSESGQAGCWPEVFRR
jgi:hypothetical protein